MKISKFLMLILLISPFVAYADCPDNDFDGHPESCVQENKMIPSEDNCPDVANEDQKWPARYQYVEGENAWELVEDKSTYGQQCNYDTYPDGRLTSTDVHMVYAWIHGQLPYLEGGKNMIADFNRDGTYSVEELCIVQAAVLRAGGHVPYRGNCPFVLAY